MKKILFLAVFILCTGFSRATKNMIFRWKSDDVTFTVRDNYGTPFSEEIRARSQREKAYHVFNLLNHGRAKLNLNINLQNSALDMDEIQKKAEIEIKPEEYNPVYERGKLLYLKWAHNSLELESDGVTIFRSERAFALMGRKGENILIAQDGKLKYLDESEWLDMEPLKGFALIKMKWLNENSIIVFAERGEDGKRFLALCPVTKADAEFIPVPGGKLIDFLYSPHGRQVLAVCFDKGVWNIYGYDRREKTWTLKELSTRRIYPLAAKDTRIFWWDPEISKIVVSDGTLISGIQAMVLSMYSQGEYFFGETENSLRPAEPVKKTVLFYGAKAEEALKNAGFGKIEKFDTDPDIWLFPENYRSSFGGLPKNIGHVFLSLKDKRLYYDRQKNNLRAIGYIKLRPAIPKEYILIFVGLILLILLVNDLMKKTRTFRK
jgi:hypothetical protein